MLSINVHSPACAIASSRSLLAHPTASGSGYLSPPLATAPIGVAQACVQEVGTRLAKGIWFHLISRQPNIKVSWSGITEAEEEDLAIWLKES